MTSLKQMQEFDQKLNELKNSYSASFKTLLLQAFREEIFEKYPNVEFVRFVGYANYFNDGDPCPFNLREFKVQFEEYDGLIDSYGDFEGFDDEEEFDTKDIANYDVIMEAIESIYDCIDSDMFENAYGSDNEVIFYADGKVTNKHYGQHD